MELLKITDRVKILLPESNEERTFDENLCSKEDRYYLHRVFGKLTSMEIRLITYNELKNNKELQEMISEREIGKLVRLGFLEYVNTEEQGYTLQIRFSPYKDVYSVDITDEYTQKSVEITTKHPIFEKACFCALSEYFRNKRG